MNPLPKFTITQRLVVVFAVLLVTSSAASVWLQVRSAHMHEQLMVQALSRNIAQNIVDELQLTGTLDLKSPQALRDLFNRLMSVNPSVEVYLLHPDGRIAEHAAPPGHLRQDRVSLQPIKDFLQGEPLPILGDDPRSTNTQKIFSAAPLHTKENPSGYVYIVLHGEAIDTLAAQNATNTALSTTLLAILAVGVLCFIVGAVAFALITKPLYRLTQTVRSFNLDNPTFQTSQTAAPPAKSQDEIEMLEDAYQQMAARITQQWITLTHQDQERRELIANVSHDLHTPLSSLYGYLETLLLKDASLDATKRQQYLAIALDQSQKVGALAQNLFDLSRLEYGFVQPQLEAFSLVDLVQDVFQKFELTAQSRHIALQAHWPQQLPLVRADLGMIERVLSNLLDNALRFTPAYGCIRVSMEPSATAVRITVSDTGSGIAKELRTEIFRKPFTESGALREGGLGLTIVYRILQLHGTTIRLIDTDGAGTAFEFALSTAVQE